MRIVIKIGTSTLTHSTGRLNIRHVEALCRVMSDIKNAGHELIVVSSGAIGVGVGKLQLDKRPDDMPSKQAAAAVGQCELMHVYDEEFAKYNHVVAQVLLTGEDIKDEHRCINCFNTLNRLLELSVLPIINENDTISTREIAVGDNDTLSALVATHIKADVLIVLTDIDGLYTSDPRKDQDAHRIETVYAISEDILKGAGGSGSNLATGGMATKITAAQICLDAGTDMVIVNGSNAHILYDILEGKNVGTRFIARS